MDKLDIAIIRELTQARRILPGRPGTAPSYREIASKLEVPHGTVRNRIKAMYAIGVIKGSTVFPNPNLLGLKSAAYTMEVSPKSRKDDAIRELRLVKGVSFVHDFIGSKAWAVFVYKDEVELKKKIKRFKEITGNEGTLSTIPYPPCRQSLTQIEARLIAELLKEGRCSYSDLSKSLRVSLRTVKRKLSQLVQEYALMSIPTIEYRAMTGCVPADIIIFFENQNVRPVAEQKVFQIVKDYLILAALWDVVGMCSLVVPKVATVTELVEKVREIEGVKLVLGEIVNQHIDQASILADYLEPFISEGSGKPAMTISP